MERNEVILVDARDRPLGVMEKMEAHRKGFLHRAFSIFIFDGKGCMLLQQRAAGKYHGAGLWTNACCSHPFPDEEVTAAAVRRLGEELGFATPLEAVFAFTYRAEVENGLVEHEYDHVFAGEFEGTIVANESEVSAWRYEEMDRLRDELARQPERFTTWFRIAFPKVEDWWRGRYGGKDLQTP